MKWEKVKLGDICTFKTGKTPSTKNPEYFNGSINWYTPGDIGESLHLSKSVRTITELALIEKQASLLPKNTILLTCIGEIGRVGILSKEACSNQQITGLIFNDKVLPNYAYYWFIANRNILKDKSNNAVVPILNNASLREISFTYPPLYIQEQIADTLDKADALRRKDQELLSKYDELAQAIFYDMFGDPVRNEKKWDIKKLGISCDVGSSVRVFVDELVGDGVPFYRGAEIGKLATNQKVNPELFITNDHYSNLKKQGGVPQIGDLLLPSICSDGRIYEVIDDNPFYFKDGRVLWIKVNKKTYNSTFLRCLLKEVFLRNYSSIASGTTFAELKIFILKNLELIEPPLKQQIDFSSRLAILSSVFLKSNESASLSSNIFNRISTEYFS